MTPKQAQSLLREAVRCIAKANSRVRRIYSDTAGRTLPRSVAYEIARADMLAARLRRAVAGPKGTRRAK